MARPIEADLSGSRGGQQFSADPERLQANLARLGQLDIRDFLLLDAAALSRVAAEVTRTPDLALAFNNAPDVLLRIRRSLASLPSANPPSDFCIPTSAFVPSSSSFIPHPSSLSDVPQPRCSPSSFILHPSSLSDVLSAQTRLTHIFALDLLQAKAPPLYDALPWHGWDFSIVSRRFKLWQTRFLLAGAGTGVTMCHCRKSAGVFAIEPHAPTARYIEAKATIEKVKRFRLLRPSSSSPSPQPLVPIPLSDASADLAIIASAPLLQTADCRLQTLEFTRVARNVLVVENSPLSPPLDPEPLITAGFTQSSVQVRAIGPRPCWWHLQK